MTISDGYTLELADDVTKTSTTAAGWTLEDSSALYKNSSTMAGYTLADNKISYVNASGGDTLVTVTGVKSLDGISLNGTVVTVSNAALEAKTFLSAATATLSLSPTTSPSPRQPTPPGLFPTTSPLTKRRRLRRVTFLLTTKSVT